MRTSEQDPRAEASTPEVKLNNILTAFIAASAAALEVPVSPHLYEGLLASGKEFVASSTLDVATGQDGAPV